MRILIAFLILLTAPSAHAFEADATIPYRWRVLVRFEPHPLVTPSYQAQVLRELSSALSPLVDGVGSVTVVDVKNAPADTLAQAVKASGFQAFDDPQSRRITGEKTHLLAIRVEPSGKITLTCRGVDGSTGLATPNQRLATVTDFAQVGRAGGLLVGREFGPVGTLEPPAPNAERVSVQFQAGALPGFDRLVRAGDVFAVTLVRTNRTETVGQLRDWTLLRAESDARAGRVECRVLTRYLTPFRTGRSVLGFRCIKLATATAPLAVKLVDPSGKSLPPGNMVQVRASDVDFLPRTDGRDRLSPTANSESFRTTRPFRGVACVVVSVGTVGEERFPIAVTGPEPVTLPFQPDPEVQKRARIELARDELRNRVAEARETLVALTGDLARRLDAGKNEEALTRGEQGLTALAAQDGPLADDLKRFTELAGADHPDIAPFTQAITQLQTDRSSVKVRVEQLRGAVAAKLDPGRFEKEFRAKDLSARVRLALDRGDVPEALDLLEQLARITDDVKVRERRAKLEVEYQPRSEAHAQARTTVAQALRTPATVAEFQTGLNQLASATKVLVEVNDRYGLRAVATTVESSYTRLKEVLDRVDNRTPSGQQEIQDLQRVTESLRKLQLEAQGKAAAIEAGVKP